MSTLKVNNITDTSDNSLLGRRNLIINGAMNVAQRGTSATGVTGAGLHTVDRWYYQESGGATVTLTQENSGTRPVGFNNFHRVEVTTADSTTDSTDYATVKQIIEAKDVHCLNYGTSDARDFTLSFWVRSSVTGTFSVAFYSQASTSYSYSTSYTIDSANTWEYKTITVPGNTTQAHDDANYGIQVRFMMTSGSGKTQTADTWQSGNYWGVSGQTQMMETSGATWDLTGVQVEVGSVATPFEHRSYAEELPRCQRFYQRFGGGTSNHSSQIGNGTGWSGSEIFVLFHYPVAMRSAPSLSYSGYPNIWSNGSQTTATSWNIGGSETTTHSTRFDIAHGSSITPDGASGWVAFKSDSSAWWSLDAEL